VRYGDCGMVIDPGIRIRFEGLKTDWARRNKVTSGEAAGNFGLQLKHR